MVTLVTCKQSFPLFSGQGDGFSFGSTSTLLCLVKEFASKQQRAPQEDRKRPTACVKPVSEGCGFQCSSAVCIPACRLLKSISSQRHAILHLSQSSEHMSHTADPDASHLKQLASVTSWLGLDPFSGGLSAGCIAFTAHEQHC